MDKKNLQSGADIARSLAAGFSNLLRSQIGDQGAIELAERVRGHLANLNAGKISEADFDRLVPPGELGKAAIIWGMDDPMHDLAYCEMDRRLEGSKAREQEKTIAGFAAQFDRRKTADRGWEEDSDIWGD